jgi:hypothetical protein
MLSTLTSLVSSADPVAGRRDFGHLSIFERVLDTGQRTIAIDNVATVSIGTARYRFWRWVFWGLTGLFVLGAIIDLFQIVQYYSDWGFNTELLTTALTKAAVAAIFFFVARWLKDVTYLSIGASDGSLSTFKSHDQAFLADIKNFLTEKINEKNLGAKLAADFAAAAKQPITVNHYGDVHQNTYEGTVISGSGHSVNLNSPGAAAGYGSAVYSASNSPGAQLGSGNIAAGNRNSVTHVDYSSVLPNIEQWQRYAAQNKGWEHVAERLQEFETLLRSGTPTPDSKGKVRTLAVDLSSILQGYPAAVQLFQAVMKLAGF